MNRKLIEEQRKMIKSILHFLYISESSCNFYTPEVTTRLLELRKTLMKADKEAEDVVRRSAKF